MRWLAYLLLASLPFAGADAGIPDTGTHGAANAITVLLDYEQPYSRTSFDSLQRQLQHLLKDAGLNLDVRQRNEVAPHEQFSDVVVFQMKGRCSMEPLPIGALSDERGALAMAYSSDGAVLPFGAVECDRIRGSLQKVLGRAGSQANQSVFGAALGLVLAHELYHMLGHSAVHTRHGLTKESLSARELLAGDLSLPDIARMAISQGQRELAKQ